MIITECLVRQASTKLRLSDSDLPRENVDATTIIMTTFGTFWFGRDSDELEIELLVPSLGRQDL